MDVRVLGPVEVFDDQGEPLPLGARQRQLLALLVRAYPDAASGPFLMDAIWDGDDDATRASLHTAVRGLRRVMGPDAVETTRVGYRLALSPDAIDAARLTRDFAELYRSSPADLGRLMALEGLWRGPAYADVVEAIPALETEARRLEELRRAVGEAVLRARLEAAPDAVLPDLRALVSESPLHEPYWEMLATALAAAGRRADAISVLQEARRTLALEVGLEPGPTLTALEDDLLMAATTVAGATAPTTRFVSAWDGTRIAFWVRGEGPPLVHVQTWSRAVEATLSHPAGSAFYDAVGADRTQVWIGYRGVGPSQQRVDDLSPAARAEDVRAVLESLGIAVYDVFSDGDGVPAALHLATTELAPRRLVAFMPHLGPMSWLSPGAMERFVETMRANGRFGRRMIADIVLPDAPTGLRRWFNETMHQVIDDETIARCLSAQTAPFPAETLTEVRCPVLVVTRRSSNSIRPESGADLARLLPDGRSLVVSGSAGVPWLDPGDLVSATREFLALPDAR